MMDSIKFRSVHLMDDGDGHHNFGIDGDGDGHHFKGDGRHVCYLCTYVPDLCCLGRILEYDKNSKPFGFLHQLDLTSILSCFEYKNIISKKTHFFQSAIIFQIIYLKIFGNSSCICLIELSTAS